MDDTDKALVILAGKELPGPCLRANKGCKCRERYHQPGPFRYWCVCCLQDEEYLKKLDVYIGSPPVPSVYNCDGSLR